jgi:sugar phosphate permease
MNDRFGARAVLPISLLLIGISLVLSSFATALWQLAILYGVSASIGFSGASNVTATSVAARWFQKKRGTAMGIVLTGMAAGQLVVVPMTLYLVTEYEWRFSMLVLGLIVGCVFSPLTYLFMRSKPSDMGLKPYGEEEHPEEQENHEVGSAQPKPKLVQESVSIYSIMKTKSFWMLTIPYFICGFTDMGFIATHFIPYTEAKGVPIGWIAFTFTLIAFFNLVGTFGTGYLSDRIHRGKLLAVIYSLRAVTFISLFTVDSMFALVVFGILYGATEMASIAPTSSICAHLFGRYSIGTILGFISVSHQFGAAAGSLIPGLFYDWLGSYSLIIMISVLLLGTSAMIVSRIPDTEQKEAKGLFQK